MALENVPGSVVYKDVFKNLVTTMFDATLNWEFVNGGSDIKFTLTLSNIRYASTIPSGEGTYWANYGKARYIRFFIDNGDRHDSSVFIDAPSSKPIYRYSTGRAAGSLGHNISVTATVPAKRESYSITIIQFESSPYTDCGQLNKTIQLKIAPKMLKKIGENWVEPSGSKIKELAWEQTGSTYIKVDGEWKQL